MPLKKLSCVVGAFFLMQSCQSMSENPSDLNSSEKRRDACDIRYLIDSLRSETARLEGKTDAQSLEGYVVVMDEAPNLLRVYFQQTRNHVDRVGGSLNYIIDPNTCEIQKKVITQ